VADMVEYLAVIGYISVSTKLNDVNYFMESVGSLIR
jgi:hypothetical protein